MGDEHILPVWLFENLVANLEQVLAEKDADERQLMALGIAVDLLGAAIDQASAVQESTQFVTVPSDALPISTYYNENVYDNQNSKIGDVNDILLDKDGRVSALIVGVGGFLGVGEKNVAVPFNVLKVAEKDGDRYLVMNATKEALQSAPGYTFDKTKGVWVPETKKPS